MTLQYTEGVEAFTLAPFTGVLGWTKEEVEVFNVGVRNHAKDRRIHTLHNLWVSLFDSENQSGLALGLTSTNPLIAILYTLRSLSSYVLMSAAQMSTGYEIELIQTQPFLNAG